MMHGGLIGKDIDDFYDAIDFYKVAYLGIWGKENLMLKKEGKKMIESMNLIDLYANEHKENIEKETKEKDKKLRENCSIINKYKELKDKYKNDLKELYLSQFNEEEVAKMIYRDMNDEEKPLKYSECRLEQYFINDNYKPDNYEEKIEIPYREKMEELNNLIKTVKAHVGIAKTKEEVEEILTRYGILDKRGKLVAE